VPRIDPLCVRATYLKACRSSHHFKCNNAVSEHDSLLEELEESVTCGSVQHRLTVLQRVTDLFVAGSQRYSGSEIAVFDDVLTRLAAEIETKALVRLSRSMAKLPTAPPKLVRRLAFDNTIVVAAPVLTSSPHLTDCDLIENASTKSQDHLYAIAQRLKLTEAVTDVLIARGDRRVLRRTARNQGARFSLAGYHKLVTRARDDSNLACTIGQRTDIPRQCFLKLLETASANVREKLEAINPQATPAIRETVAKVALSMQREAREASRHHADASRDARHLFRAHELSETHVHRPATTQQFEKTAVALSLLGPFPIDLVERALIHKGTDMILILVRAAGCSWTTAKATLLMHAAGRGLSQQDMEAAFKSFERLRPATARRVVNFYERRGKRPDEPNTCNAAVPAVVSDTALRTAS
jgi:uncharacterized protein (DUF2336 family)